MSEVIHKIGFDWRIEFESTKLNKSIKTASLIFFIMISSLWLFFQTRINNQKSLHNSEIRAKKLLYEERINGADEKSNEDLKLEAIFKE
jgi:hypothetical protein